MTLLRDILLLSLVSLSLYAAPERIELRPITEVKEVYGEYDCSNVTIPSMSTWLVYCMQSEIQLGTQSGIAKDHCANLLRINHCESVGPNLN